MESSSGDSQKHSLNRAPTTPSNRISTRKHPKRSLQKSSSNHHMNSYRGNGFDSKTPKYSTPAKKTYKKKETPKIIYNFDEIHRILHEHEPELTHSVARLANRKLENVIMRRTWKQACFHSNLFKEKADAFSKSVKGLLNKLTPTNADVVCVKLQELLNASNSRIICSLLLEKASMEQKYAETFAGVFHYLVSQFDFLRRDLLSACQAMFEDSGRELEGLNDTEKADLISKQRRKCVGLVYFIGELYNKKLVSPKRILLICEELLNHPIETSIESICYLLSTCKGIFSSTKFKADAQDLLKTLEEMMPKLPTRIRFQVMDLLETGILKKLEFLYEESPEMIQEKRL